jgi:hypothetical protein
MIRQMFTILNIWPDVSTTLQRLEGRFKHLADYWKGSNKEKRASFKNLVGPRFTRHEAICETRISNATLQAFDTRH